ncbi:hypothetical protein, partial [Zooshikella ganghwensis]|uniref:hypothetical protein n=1 Tax=Zooshikella ganghwensis TaxID=202772 RepID=UPI0005707C40
MRHLSCTCFFVCLLCSLSASGEYIYHASQGVPGPRFNSVDEACRYYEGNKYRPKYNKVYLLNRSFTTYPYGTSFLMTQCAYEHLGQIERFHTIYSVRLESCYDYAPYWNPKDLICSSKNYCDDLEGETTELTISKKRLKEGDISKLMVNTCIAHISSLNCSINESGEEICQVEAVYTGDPGDNTLERSIDITGNNTNLNENGTGDCSSPDTTP